MEPAAVAFVRDFVQSGKPVASICHGPWNFVEADVARGRRLTSFPSIRTDLRNAGAEVVDEEVVTDGNITTSRSPDDLPAFCKRIVQEFARAFGRGQPSPVSADAFWVPELDRFISEHDPWVAPEALARLQEIREEHARAAGLVALSAAVDAPLEIAGLGGELKPFQRAGVDYLLRQRRSFLADEQGLGKTVEALAMHGQSWYYPSKAQVLKRMRKRALGSGSWKWGAFIGNSGGANASAGLARGASNASSAKYLLAPAYGYGDGYVAPRVPRSQPSVSLHTAMSPNLTTSPPGSYGFDTPPVNQHQVYAYAAPAPYPPNQYSGSTY